MMLPLPEILLENEDFIALNKPAGLLSIPDRKGDEPSLKTLLIAHYGKIFTVHRIDRHTSGVIVFAKNEAAHKYLSQAFEDRSVEKYYCGFVKGILPEKEKTIQEPIIAHPGKAGMMTIHKKGKPAITEYKVVEAFGKYSFLQFRIHTGRTHQIRVHMRHIEHPLVCDELYGDPAPVRISSLKKNYNLSKSEIEERPILNRLALHAERLVFTDAAGKIFTIEAPLPKDMRALLQQLRKWKKHGAV